MIDSSPRAVAQRQQMDRMLGNTMQLVENPEEELQMKAGPTDAAQLAEIPEEELQMKAGPTDTAQLAEIPEEELQTKAVPGTAQREPALDEELPLQGKSIASGSPTQLRPNRDRKTNKTGLPGNVKVGVENLSGVSLDNVNVHFNSAKPAQLNALAYTQGTDIHVGPGQEKHLSHEAWHVVQQSKGQVKPTTQMSETQVNDDVRLEREADVMGKKAKSLNSVTVQSREIQQSMVSNGLDPVQKTAVITGRKNLNRGVTRAIRAIEEAGYPGGNATENEIRIHDEAMNPGQHHRMRVVRRTQLTADLEQRKTEHTDRNISDVTTRNQMLRNGQSDQAAQL